MLWISNQNKGLTELQLFMKLGKGAPVGSESSTPSVCARASNTETARVLAICLASLDDQSIR